MVEEVGEKMSEGTDKMNTEDQVEEVPTEEKVDMEASAEEPAESTEISETDKLKEDLEKSQKDYLYLRADFDNYRKKMIEERSQWKKYGAEAVLRELVGIIDNFDLALMTEVNEDNLESFHQGVKMIRSEISF